MRMAAAAAELERLRGDLAAEKQRSRDLVQALAAAQPPELQHQHLEQLAHRTAEQLHRVPPPPDDDLAALGIFGLGNQPPSPAQAVESPPPPRVLASHRGSSPHGSASPGSASSRSPPLPLPRAQTSPVTPAADHSRRASSASARRRSSARRAPVSSGAEASPDRSAKRCALPDCCYTVRRTAR